MPWENNYLIMRNLRRCPGLLPLLALFVLITPVDAQMYYPDTYYQDPYGNWGGYDRPQQQPARRQPAQGANRGQQRQPLANLQYDRRDAESILQDQLSRAPEYPQVDPRMQQQAQMYDPYSGRVPPDEGQIRRVMAEARYIGSLIGQKNGKSYVVFDKRTFQFYLYDRYGRLLRIGPVAIGKGRTDVGAFETPIGIFPIKSKIAVDDWIRPDWYFIEEGEPIPKKWEDRRVPGFFRYKLVFDGTRYIHYAEATGGRLTHGCLGLDWQDAEAVFHTLDVGSFCIVLDQNFITRLARGDFPIKKPPAKPAKPEEVSTAATEKADTGRAGVVESARRPEEKTFGSLW